MLEHGESFFHGIGILSATSSGLELNFTGVANDCGPIHARFAIGGHMNPMRAAGTLDVQRRLFRIIRNGFASSFERRRDVHVFSGVIVEDSGERHGIAYEKETRRLETDDERLFGARRGIGNPKLVATGNCASRGFPASERVGIFQFDGGFSLGVSVNVRLPGDGRAKIAADNDGRLRLAGRRCSQFGRRLHLAAAFGEAQ